MTSHLIHKQSCHVFYYICTPTGKLWSSFSSGNKSCLSIFILLSDDLLLVSCSKHSLGFCLFFLKPCLYHLILLLSNLPIFFILKCSLILFVSYCLFWFLLLYFLNVTSQLPTKICLCPRFCYIQGDAWNDSVFDLVLFNYAMNNVL